MALASERLDLDIGDLRNLVRLEEPREVDLTIIIVSYNTWREVARLHTLNSQLDVCYIV